MENYLDNKSAKDQIKLKFSQKDGENISSGLIWYWLLPCWHRQWKWSCSLREVWPWARDPSRGWVPQVLTKASCWKWSSINSRLGKMNKADLKSNSWSPVRSSKIQTRRQAWNQGDKVPALGVKSHSEERQGWGQARLGHSSPRTSCPELISAGHPGCTGQGVQHYRFLVEVIKALLWAPKGVKRQSLNVWV